MTNNTKAKQALDDMYKTGHLRTVPEWQPIETAPINKRVLLYGGAGGVKQGYLDDLGNWRKLHHGSMNTKPRYWMPLPAPPTEGK